MNDSVSGVLSAGQACTCDIDIVEFPALMTPQSHLSIRPTTSFIPAPIPGNPAYYNLLLTTLILFITWDGICLWLCKYF